MLWRFIVVAIGVVTVDAAMSFLVSLSRVPDGERLQTDANRRAVQSGRLSKTNLQLDHTTGCVVLLAITGKNLAFTFRDHR
jgi:hypothetical protein